MLPAATFSDLEFPVTENATPAARITPYKRKSVFAFSSARSSSQCARSSSCLANQRQSSCSSPLGSTSTGSIASFGTSIAGW